eukprot:TRINITY_DN1741_c0_g1_i2.p1 TRINITY_DN1741_c0_g1~~TRINITY_DN1741_c0_g1_i2.p1  ORF type:complete len:614 (-),score=239.75 TRINITY_DN1741_c0_g1_i2:40-1881(-)
MEKSHINTGDKAEIVDYRAKLLNTICATMIHEPSYYADVDETKFVINRLVARYFAAGVDLEFVFKLAYYVREELNVRSTANYLLAVAANEPSCHQFFAKYFDAIVRLPSDMLEVVSLFMKLPNKYLSNPNSIPSALRKAIIKKFPTFDVYQLAKYNKEKAQKKKGVLTLKQLVRKVHLDQPAAEAMALVGKKYPLTEEAFKKTGLPGEFDTERAGKTMKLPVPETWETLLSAKGNKHTTWEELLDHNKLPFMAMLRNLRNFIVTGISPQHHQKILARLTDENSVASSRQLPWRFLSAYDAINVDLEGLMNDILDHDGSEFKIVKVKVRGAKGKKMAKNRTIKKRVIIPVHMPDMPLIASYREAIDTAIKFATMKNLPPIDGKTVVFVDVSGSMKSNKCSRGNLGKLQTSMDIAILLGLMIQFAAEDCNYRIFSSPANEEKDPRCDLPVELIEDTILNNVARVIAESEKLGGGTNFPFEYLEDIIAKKVHIDRFVILSDMMIAPGHQEMDRHGDTSVSKILSRYRAEVNPDMIFFAVDLFGNGKSIANVDTENPLNVLITGFSDNILRFIAEKGNSKQLEHVINIDKVITEKANKSKLGKRKHRPQEEAVDAME